MKPQSIAFVLALLTASALSHGQTLPPGGAQDYEAMAKAMEKAQAQANQPGDEATDLRPAAAATRRRCAGS